MLDVHPPHERIHGIRDFSIHLLTITVGLLIALGLEGCVERIHHIHLRNEATSNLRQEIKENQHQLDIAHEANTAEQANLMKAEAFLLAQRAGKPYDITGIGLAHSVGPLSDASWRTASATGALNYMEYSQVQKYAAAYQVQEEFAQLQSSTFESFLQLNSYIVSGVDPRTMTPAEAQAAIIDLRHTLTHLKAMDQIGKTLQRTYQKALSAD